MRAAVLAAGGSELGARALEDVYYDTQHATLARRDCWLRARGGRWELKVPPGLALGGVGDGGGGGEGAAEARSGGERGVFEEIEGAVGFAGCHEPFRGSLLLVSTPSQPYWVSGSNGYRSEGRILLTLK